MRIRLLTISALCCIATGCGGDDESPRPAESNATDTAAEVPTTPSATTAETAETAPPDQPAKKDGPVATEPDRPARKPVKKPRSNSGRKQAPPAVNPGSPEDDEEAQRRAREGVPMLGASPDN